MLSEKYLDNHIKNLDMIKSHHKVMGSSGVGRITAANPRAGFVGDPDVMDTWATSSLTPQIAAGWEEPADPATKGTRRAPKCPRRSPFPG